ncbi:hypothetical protein [Alloactinosynnema sp. L-07]|uniref:hypothetical protein n=1 Tax=Alloactinosynnema sp. L-07 TaxID=1653480 RepID=UPI00065F0BAA|nr:hypothetical protein [Alloactinosynnema sp. L-07]CRK59018.1 hypothetical protein [Alloactinosynnema sp. L-07]
MDNPSIAPDTAISDWLAALASHLALHPNLQASFSGTTRRDIQVYRRGFASHLHALIAWADTLGAIEPIRVTSNDQNNGVHLLLSGRMDGAHRLSVTVIPNAPHVAALASHTSLAVGDRFDISLIRTLLKAEASPRVRVIRHGDIYDGTVLRRTEKRIVLGEYAAWYPGEGEYIADDGDRLSIPLSDGTTVIEHVDVTVVDAAHELALAGTPVTT